MEKRFLRILYTINAGQYILARSLTAVETTTIPSSTEGAEPSYGYVSLRRCLNIVCQSSPEVFQDLSNGGGSDFSVYHLDPLEAETAPEQLSITDNGESRSAGPQTRGVAVGMGLMSWGLHSAEGEEATLNGTLTKLANGSAGLEVILALRETARISQESFPLATPMTKQQCHIHDPTTVATIAAIKNRQKQTEIAKPRRAKPKPKVVPQEFTSEAERLYHTSDIYIGPAKAKKGQMAAPTTFPNTQPLASTSAAVSASRGPLFLRSTSLPSTKCNTTSSTLSEPLGAPVEISPHVATGTASTSRPTTPPPKHKHKKKPVSPNGPPFTYKPVTFLSSSTPPSSIPSTSNSTIDSNILPQLISILSGGSSIPDGMQNQALLTALSSIDSVGAGEDNPALARALQVLMASWSQETPRHSDLNQPTPEGVVRDKENVNPTKPTRSHSNEKQRPSTPSPTRPSLASVRNSTDLKALHTNTNSITRKRNFSDFSDNNEEQLGRRGQQPFTSPSRPVPSRMSVDVGGSRGRPILIPDSPQTSRVSASSPVRGAAQEKGRRKYVVPAWARTSTALTPRLSEDAQLTQRLNEELEREERDRRERDRKTASRKRNLTRAKTMPESSNVEKAPTGPATESTGSTPAPSSPPRPSMMSVVAACGSHSASSIFSSPKKPTSSPPCTPPRTPKRRNAPGSSSTPMSSSLFTPLAWGTPLAPGQIFSPLRGKGASNLDESTDTPSSLPIASDDDEDDSPCGEENTTMVKQPEFWEGLPPSSPVASSPFIPLRSDLDIDIDITTSEEDTGIDMESEDNTVKHEPGSMDTDMDIFDMFTNLNTLGSSEFAPPPDQDGLSELDFTEFWQAFTPLVEDHNSSSGGGVGVSDFGVLDSDNATHVDPVQLAGQMQSLFAGCLM